MLSPKEIQERKDAMFKAESDTGIESFIWMSFCDPDKPKGHRFLGVIVTQSLGLTHAIIKTHKLGINPGGEIQSFVLPAGTLIDVKYLNRLIPKEELESKDFPL
jgi:hypothetical protein